MPLGHPFVRDAMPDDAEALQQIWADFTSDPPHQPHPRTSISDVRQALERIAQDPVQRLVVAVSGDQPVGVAHLRLAAVSPIHGEEAVHVGYLHVLSAYRRRGIGRMLIETAADWADQMGSKHVVASVAATARVSNRFLARLGMPQVAVVRATTVCALRSRLRAPAGLPVASTVVTARRLVRLRSVREPAGR